MPGSETTVYATLEGTKIPPVPAYLTHVRNISWQPNGEPHATRGYQEATEAGRMPAPRSTLQQQFCAPGSSCLKKVKPSFATRGGSSAVLVTVIITASLCQAQLCSCNTAKLNTG